jgi:PBP1b-binding outer membrane lipoprotein LpoB
MKTNLHVPLSVPRRARLPRVAVWLAAGILALLLGGCATPNAQPTGKTAVIHPDERDNIGGTGIDSEDVRTAASRMAGAILSVPAVAAKPGAAGIAIAPVRNSSRHLIDKDIFTARLRVELNKVAQGRVRFFAQGVGQEARAEIIRDQDEEAWDQLLNQCAEVIARSTVVVEAKQPVRVAVIPLKKTNIVGQNADSLTARLRAYVSEKAQGKIQFLAREENGKIISQVLAENDLRSVGLVAGSSAEKAVGVDYFLGGEFIADSLTPQSGGQRIDQHVGVNSEDPRKTEIAQSITLVSGNVAKYLNVMLINASTGAVPVEKMVRVERKLKSGLEQADFVLTGELRGVSKAAAGGDRSDYILMSFQLVDTQSNLILWEDAYETKKVSSIGVIYK